MKQILSFILLLLLCSSCEAYCVIDTDKPLIVKQQLSHDEYVVTYSDRQSNYYMHIISSDSLHVGDTLTIKPIRP